MIINVVIYEEVRKAVHTVKTMGEAEKMVRNALGHKKKAKIVLSKDGLNG